MASSRNAKKLEAAAAAAEGHNIELDIALRQNRIAQDRLRVAVQTRAALARKYQDARRALVAERAAELEMGARVVVLLDRVPIIPGRLVDRWRGLAAVEPDDPKSLRQAREAGMLVCDETGTIQVPLEFTYDAGRQWATELTAFPQVPHGAVLEPAAVDHE